jgi:DNA-binding FadR family transcriptional regulator
MQFDPVARRSLPDAVFEQLIEQIFGGKLEVGTKLPSERHLCELLGVNRGAVREALKRLSQAGLLSVRQGGGNEVRDYKRDGGLDLLPYLLFRGGTRIDHEVARSVLEMRAALAPEIAARCAERAGPKVHGRLRLNLEQLHACGDDLDARQLRSLELWDTVADGAGNIAYRLAFNTLRETYGHVRLLLAQALAEELCADELYAVMVSGIVERDPERARKAAQEMTQLGSDGVFALLELLQGPGPTWTPQKDED